MLRRRCQLQNIQFGEDRVLASALDDLGDGAFEVLDPVGFSEDLVPGLLEEPLGIRARPASLLKIPSGVKSAIQTDCDVLIGASDPHREELACSLLQAGE